MNDTAVTARLAEAVTEALDGFGLHGQFYGRRIADELLPVVREIADQQAAEAARLRETVARVGALREEVHLPGYIAMYRVDRALEGR